MKIAVVVPTNRPLQYKSFKLSWNHIFQFHNVALYVVLDGDKPAIDVVNGSTVETRQPDKRFKGLFFNHCDAIRNAGFVEAVKDGAEAIITLDDDVVPIQSSDPIEGHLETLSKKVSINWFNPYTNFMRGFPYGVRKEARVVASHGIWSGMPDVDAPTQLKGFVDEKFPYKGPLPIGCLSPISGMNFAFKREASPHVYFAPNDFGVQRFGDIFMGIHLKRWTDANNMAIYHGGSIVHHDRLSNVFENLKREGIGLQMNEGYFKGQHNDSDYEKSYYEKRIRWMLLMNSL